MLVNALGLPVRTVPLVVPRLAQAQKARPFQYRRPHRPVRVVAGQHECVALSVVEAGAGGMVI